MFVVYGMSSNTVYGSRKLFRGAGSADRIISQAALGMSRVVLCFLVEKW